MAATFNIQKPYVLATLPRPLNHSGSSYAVGDVWGQQPGSKKRRRPELVVGIDGEAANIYDVPSSKLVTSYPIPPQSTFTCPPCSLRWRSSKSKDITRHTYISTQDPTAKVTLFKDVVEASGHSRSTTVSRAVGHNSKLIFLATSSSANSNASQEESASDLIAVAEDGTVICLHGETLEEKWRSSPDILRQDLINSSKSDSLKVELVQAALATDAIEGFFAGKDDSFSALSQKIEANSYNPDILVFVTKSTTQSGIVRHVHLLALTATAGSKIGGNVLQIHTAPFPSRNNPAATPSYRLDVASGSLLELRKDTLYTYSLASSVIKLEQELQLSGVSSFLRLSKTSVLAANSDTLEVYNPVFRSLQASTTLAQTQGTDKTPFQLVSYFARTELAVAIHGTSLVAVQLEAPKMRSKKRRAEGLLIDSLGRAISHDHTHQRKRGPRHKSDIFSDYIPGSLTEDYWPQFEKDMAEAEKLHAEKNLASFEELLAGKFGIELRKPEQLTNGTHPETAKNEMEDDTQTGLPEWVWPETRADYPRADRRWVIYAITKVFAWHASAEDSESGLRLECQLPESSVLNFLIDAGHLTVSNLKSAFRNEVRDVDDVDLVLGEAVPQVLVQVEPTFEFLLAYLSSTKLGVVELLTSVRLIMQSLELIQDPTKMAPKLLTFSSHEAPAAGEEGEHGENGEIGMELDRLEQEIEVTESYLGNESSTRARGLSVAFGKLGSCPSIPTIKFLRQHYKPEEILSLIYVLRMELVKDGWTTRYLDTTRLDEDEDLEPPPDGSIRLIADLLSRCIDSVGPGGWLINDAIISAGAGEHLDSSDFLASLKLEVSAALEGVQEAVFLRGIISEAARFGASAVAATPTPYKGRKANAEDKPRELKPAHAADAAMLPLGMKANARISAEKIVSGGEVVTRSKRNMSLHISRKVQAYSLERIVI